MKRFKKRHIGLVVLAVGITLMFTPVFGQDVDKSVINFSEFDSQNKIQISGRIKNGEVGIDISIMIFAHNKDYSDIVIGNDFGDLIVFQDQVSTDKDGNFSTTARFDFPSGWYTLYAGISDKSDIIDGNGDIIQFVNRNSNRAIISDVKLHASDKNSESEKEYIKNLLLDEQKMLDLGLSADLKELYSFLDEEAENIADILHTTACSATLQEEDTDTVNICVVINGLNNGSIKNIDTYKQAIPYITEGRLSKWYEKVPADKITAEISHRGIKSTDEFEGALIESILLNIVKKPDGINNIKKSFADFKTEIKQICGYDIDNYDNDFYSAIQGKEFSSLADMFSSYKPGSSDSTIGGRGTSGGGGGYARGISAPAVETEVPNALPHSFEDMDGFEWAESYVSRLYQAGVVNGKTETEFCPSDNVTREEFVKMVVVAFNLDTKASASLTFTDVNELDWFAPYLQSAYQNGVIHGVSETEFGTGRMITRQDIAVIINNVLGQSADSCGFSDFESIPDYAQESVAVLWRLGIINGYEDGCFRGENPATRAEAAKIICLAMDAYKQSGEVSGSEN